MKKVCCMIALLAISFGTVFANSAYTPVKSIAMQTDTTKKKKVKKKDGKMKTKKDSTKKDTMSNM